MIKHETCKCPLTMSMNVIGGKWKPLIIFNLARSTKRFGQLDVSIPGISRKVLTSQLNELVADKIVTRTSYAESPPRVEYELNKKGKELIPILRRIAVWGEYLVNPDLN